MKTPCTHSSTTIIVLEAFAMYEKIAYQCTECKEIIKTEKS
jgi:hypothetical protein